MLDQASSLTRSGVDVQVVTPNSTSSTQSTNFLVNVTRYRYLPRQLEKLQTLSLEAAFRYSLEWPFYMAGAVFKIIRMQIDILHVHWALPFGLAGTLAQTVDRTPMVITCHGNDVNIPWLRPRYRPLLKMALKAAQAIICVSQHLKEKLVRMGIADERIHTIPIGIDTGQFNPSRVPHGSRLKAFSDKRIVGFLGSLLPNKRVNDLIRAASIISSNQRDVAFAVGGEGPEQSNLRGLVASLDESNVQLLGRINRSEVPGFLKELDVFVLPSMTEGLSIALQEAMAMGCIPVVSNSIECSDLLEHGTNGFYYESGSPEDLAAKVQMALDASEAMGQNARKTIVEKFDLEKNTRRLLDLYCHMHKEH